MFSKPLYDENIEATLRWAYVSPEVLLATLEALIEAHYKEQICYELGFNNMVYFCRFFKKREEMSLTEWRSLKKY